jgi:hypothetical protein
MSYVIEARSFRFAFACSHNFWVLRRGDGHSVAELHGLAFDRTTRTILPIGTTRDHSLRVFIFPHERDYAMKVGRKITVTHMFEASRSRAVYRGRDVLARWEAAIAAMPVLEELDLTYPPYGFNVLSPTVNSNSAYRTFGEIMDVPIHKFVGVLQPGLGSVMVSPQTLKRLRYRRSPLRQPEAAVSA